MKNQASIGVVEQANRVILVTVSSSGALLDRRTVELTSGLPTHPHHHEGSWAVGRYLDTPGARRLTLGAAVKLVERVAAAALAGARGALKAIASDVKADITHVALRRLPALPEGIAARIEDHRAQTQADSAMYREAVAQAAREWGWAVQWYDRDALDTKIPVRPSEPPWTAAHRLAAAAALRTRPAARVRRART